jgi:hypothetical protein
MASLIEHLEKHLGTIELGWTDEERRTQERCQVALMRSNPDYGLVSLSTIGLHRTPLYVSKPRKEVRVELLMLLKDDQHSNRLASIMFQIAASMLDSGRAPSRGEVIGPAGSLVPGSALEAFYISSPAYQDDDFATWQDGDRQVVMVWLVPITVEEANYVLANGWEAFENLLVIQDPDLTDLGRSSLH